jgi:hypothetical protein
LYFDYRFQYALNINNIEKDGLCINTIGNFRRRLVEHEIEHEVDLLNIEIESISEAIAEFMQLNKTMARTEAYEHLKRLLSEQCIETENGVLAPIDGTSLKSTILQNPSDSDSTYRKKGRRVHIGYTVNVVKVRDQEKGPV